MRIASFKTKKVRAGDDIFTILDAAIKEFPEGAVLAITSKVVALSEGRTVARGSVKKEDLIAAESEWILPRTSSKYDVTLTIARDILVAYAGVDESNGDGHLVLWPKDAFASANAIRRYIRKRFKVRRAGVIVTDSRTTPLRWGTTGFALSWSGFEPLKNYIGKPDLFGRKLKMTKANLADGLAAAAVLTMGEGSEQTPLALLSDLPFVKFVDKDATFKEISAFHIKMKDDLYAPLLKQAKWNKGGGSKKSGR